MNRKFFFTITILSLSLCICLNASAVIPLKIDFVDIRRDGQLGGGSASFDENGQITKGAAKFILIKTSDNPEFTVSVYINTGSSGKYPIERHVNDQTSVVKSISDAKPGIVIGVSPGSNTIKVEVIDAEGEQVFVHCAIEVVPYSLFSWGQIGTAPGDFGERGEGYKDPGDITVDSNGYVYTTSPANKRIQKFTWDGQFATSWESDEFPFYIAHLASDGAGHIYVIDEKGVTKYSTSGNPVASWGPGEFVAEEWTWMKNMVDIAADSSGFYLLQRGVGIRHFDSNGKLKKEWPSVGGMNFPSDASFIDVDESGNIYVEHFEKLTRYNSDGSALNQIDKVANFDVAPDGNIYSGTPDLRFLSVYDKEGQKIDSWYLGEQYHFYVGIAVSRDGTVFWADNYNHRVVVLRPGEYLPVVDGSRISVASSPPTITPDGKSTSIITATLTDEEGTTLEGVNVTFSLNPNIGKLSATSGTTNANGQMEVTYTAPTAQELGDNSSVIITAAESKGGKSAETIISFKGMRLVLEADPPVALYEQQSKITVQIQWADGGLVEEPHEIKFELYAFGYPPGNISPDTVTTQDGIAEATYTAPTKAEAGKASVVKITARHSAISNLSQDIEISFGGELEIKAEPKNPGVIGDSKIAIIPASPDFPALITATSQKGNEIMFSINSTEGELRAEGKSGQSVSVTTDENGKAEVYYHFTGNPPKDKLYEELISVENPTTRTKAEAEVLVGLGLELVEVTRIQGDTDAWTSQTPFGLIVQVKSTFHPNLNLTSYVANSSWTDSKLDVSLKIDWVNKPEPGWGQKIGKFFGMSQPPDDVLYDGNCQFDRFAGKNVDALWALDSPSYPAAGYAHNLPAVHFKSEGTHILKAQIQLKNLKSGQPVLDMTEKDRAFCAVEVDRGEGLLKSLTCAFQPQSKMQYIMLEFAKSIDPSHKIVEAGLDIADFFCKVSSGDYVGAGGWLSTKYIGRLKELRDAGKLNLSERELKLLEKAIAVDECASKYADLQSRKQFLELPNRLRNFRMLVQMVSQDASEDIDIDAMANAFISGILSHPDLIEQRIVLLSNASSSQLTSDTGESASMMEGEDWLLTDAIGVSIGNVTAYIMPKADTYNLSVETQEEARINTYDGGTSQVVAYALPVQQPTTAQLTLDASGKNELQVDYNGDGTVDEIISPDIVSTDGEVEKEFVLVGIDPDEGLRVDIKQVFAFSDADELSFKVITYRPWEESMFISLGINADQALNTGNPETGADYMVFVLMEDGNAIGFLTAYDTGEEDFVPIGELSDLIWEANSDVCQFSLRLSDIGNPDAKDATSRILIDFDVRMLGEDLEAEVDFAPDEGFYTYILEEVPTVFDNALNLDGAGDYVDCGDDASLDIADEITIEAWVKIPSISASGAYILMKSKGPGDYEYGFGIYPTGKVEAVIGGTNIVEPSSSTLSSNTWYHIAATWKYPGNCIFYTDGVQTDSVATTGNIAPTSAALLIGKIRRSGDPYYFNGTIDEVRIWNVARTQVEIQADMSRQLTGSEVGLVAYYDFDEQVGSTIVHDRTANGNDGTLYGDAHFVESTRPTEPVEDTTPPTITSGPTASDITSASAVITWDTNEASSSVVEYGAKPEYGLTTEGEDGVTEHSVPLISLSLNTTYYYRVGSTDASGNTVWSEQKTVETSAEVQEFPHWDVNQDGVVDISDLVLVGIHFGEDYRQGAPISPLVGTMRSKEAEGNLYISAEAQRRQKDEAKPFLLDSENYLHVQLKITPITDLYGYQFDLGFDPTALELLTVTASPLLKQDGTHTYWTVSEQDAFISAIHVRKSAKRGIDANGTLATIVFRVKDIASSKDNPLRLTNTKLADSNAQLIPINIRGINLSLRLLFIPEKSLLAQNYPNPFNPETWIPYQLAKDTTVTISIYNTKGQLIRMLHPGNKEAGIYMTKARAAYWNGKDSFGQSVASGVYYYFLRAGEFTATRKMVILK